MAKTEKQPTIKTQLHGLDVRMERLIAAVEEAKQAAISLQNAGKQTVPNLFLAGAAAALSVRKSLGDNAKAVRRLVELGIGIDKPMIADYETMRALMEGCAGYMQNTHHKALCRVWELASTGQLDFLLDIPNSMQAQREMRQRLFDLLNGYGFSWKAISMIFLVLDPTHCWLVPLDRHHVARLGCLEVVKGHYTTAEGAPDLRCEYEAIEDEIASEQLMNGFVDLPTGVWAWAMWELYRKLVAGSSKASEGEAESHNGLSPFDY